MIFQLDAAIEAIKTVEDAKVILKQLVSAINATEESKRVHRMDLLFDGEAGPVLRGADGNYYRCSVEMASTTGSPTWTLTNLGKSKPSKE